MADHWLKDLQLTESKIPFPPLRHNPKTRIFPPPWEAPEITKEVATAIIESMSTTFHVVARDLQGKAVYTRNVAAEVLTPCLDDLLVRRKGITSAKISWTGELVTGVSSRMETTILALAWQQARGDKAQFTRSVVLTNPKQTINEP